MTHTPTKKFLMAASPLFLVLFIDGMGLGLVFPLLNLLIMDPQTAFISSNTSSAMRTFYFGITISIFMFCWFFGAAFLGDLSDKIGRKKSLMICLLGAFLSYVLSAFAAFSSSFLLLLLGRIIAGFTSGSQPIAQAAIVDLSVPEHKARNIGWILFSISIGFIFGPMLGGFLSDPSIFPFFTVATPFIFAALISLFNALLLQFLFHETFVPPPHTSSLKLHRAVEIFISAFKHEKIRSLSLIFLIMIFGWSSFYSFISMFLLQVFNFPAKSIGIFMGLLGVGFGLGNGFLVEFCNNRFALKKTIIFSCLCTACFIFLMIAFPIPLLSWAIIAPIGAGIAVAYTLLLTIFSNQVDDSSQGWIMGITGSIMAFSFGLNGLVAGLMARSGPDVPLFIAVICLLLTALCMVIFHLGKDSHYHSP